MKIVRIFLIIILICFTGIPAIIMAQDSTGFPQNNSFPELAPPTFGEPPNGGGYTTLDGEDDGPGNGGGGSNNVPIDGGLSILLAIGMAIGIKSFRLRKNEPSTPNEIFALTQ